MTLSPGRVDPGSDAWQDSRKPRRRVLLPRPDSHRHREPLNSEGDEPITGRWQPPSRASETQRSAQASEVHAFVAKILAVQKDANVVVAGDFNDFEFSRTPSILQSGEHPSQVPSLVSLPRLLPPAERYSYDFDGNSQVLDQIFVSPAVLVGGRGGHLPRIRGYDVVHVYAEFADQVSDHDPQVLRLAP